MLRRFLAHKLVLFLARLILGGVFIAAAYPKIMDPPNFAHMVYNYKLMPSLIINLSAVYLPWVELFAGVALIVGVGWRGANALVAGMLLVFIAALTFNLLRDHAIDCGCFEVTAADKTEAEMFAEMKWTIIRDIGLLVLVGYIAVASKLRRVGEATAAGSAAPHHMRRLLGARLGPTGEAEPE